MIFIYNRDEVQVDILDIDPIITEEIGKLRSLEFESEKEFEKGYRVVAKTEDGLFEFVIIDSEYQRDNIKIHTYFCQDSLIELQSIPILDKRPWGNIEVALKSILDSTRWVLEVRNGYNLTTVLRSSFYHVSALEAFSEIVEKYRSEWITEYKSVGNKITERRLVIYQRDGRSNGRLEFGKNIINFKRTILSEPIVTAIYPYGKGEDLGDGNYGRRISIEDVNNGIPFIENKQATEIYGLGSSGNKKPLFAFLILEDVEDKNELKKLAQEELDIVSGIRAEHTVDAADIDIEAKIGYEVPVIDEEIGYRAYARIIKIVRQGKDVQLTFGTVTKKFVDSFQKSISKTNKAINDVYIQINNVRASADGKTTIFTGPTEPTLSNEGDLWYRENADGTVDMLLFKNGIWVEELSEGVFKELRADIEANTQLVNDAKLAADAASAKVDTEVAKVNQNIVNLTKDLSDSIAEVDTASKNNYGELTGKVTDLTTALADKPDKTYVDQTIDEKTGTITQTIGQIETKVNELDAVPVYTIGTDGYWYKDGVKTSTLAVGKDGQSGVDGANFTWNLLKGTKDLTIGGLTYETGSRKEYQVSKIDTDYNNLTLPADITISFDIEQNTGKAFNLIVYNDNNKGPHTFDTKGITIPNGKSRQFVHTVLKTRPNPMKTENYIEFYSVYGTNNWYKITNLKIELGHTKNPTWSPHVSEIQGANGANGKDGNSFTWNLLKGSNELTYTETASDTYIPRTYVENGITHYEITKQNLTANAHTGYRAIINYSDLPKVFTISFEVMLNDISEMTIGSYLGTLGGLTADNARTTYMDLRINNIGVELKENIWQKVVINVDENLFPLKTATYDINKITRIYITLGQFFNGKVTFRKLMINGGTVASNYAPHITEIQGKDAMFASATPPTDTSLTWLDTNTNSVKRWYNGAWYDINSEIKTKLNTVVDTVDEHTQTIGQVNADLKKKVETSTFSTFKQEYDQIVSTVQKTETDLSGFKTSTTTKLNEQKQTLDANISKISNIEKDLTSGTTFQKIQTIEETADGNKTTIAEVKKTAEGAVQLTAFNNTINTVNESINTIGRTVEGIQIGGRNLILDSDKDYTNANYEIRKINYSEPLENNQEYTISIKGELGAGHVGWYVNMQTKNSSGTTVYPEVVRMVETDKRADGWYVKTVKLTNAAFGTGYTQNLVGWIYPNPLSNPRTSSSTIDKIKIEKGNKATDWSPAPEDMASLTVFNEFKRTAEQTLSIISDPTQKGLLSAINQQAGQILMQVGNATTKSRLNLTKNGTFIETALIESAHIKDAAITTAKIGDAQIDTAKIKDASISSAKIINLDVNKISGNTSEFVKSIWNGISSSTIIDGSGLSIKGDWGGNINLTRRGLTYYDGIKGQVMGYNYGLYRNPDDALVNTQMKGVGLFAERGYSLNIGIREDVKSSNLSLLEISQITDTSVKGIVTGELDMRAPIRLNRHNLLVEGTSGIKLNYYEALGNMMTVIENTEKTAGIGFTVSGGVAILRYNADAGRSIWTWL